MTDRPTSLTDWIRDRLARGDHRTEQGEVIPLIDLLDAAEAMEEASDE